MIAAVIPYLVDATTLPCHCEEPKATKQSQAIRGGEHKGAWPGHEAIAFRHCEERKILSLRGVQRRSNLKKGQPVNEAGLKLGLLNKNVSNYSSPEKSTQGESGIELDT
jgi:hypothetical protein